MRIQHNIPALSAYRNYTRNVSMVNKNLEKLSSGYKINRAGDDAAGLAISEKMRIQISGLEQAQNNAKSGINLVQTAEGALTEVHDMLNRMYTLAEQSANGTYADDVDREQLQKEINSLRTEINRIADATNYNGIKLLDGSLSSDTSAVDAAKAEAANAMVFKDSTNEEIQGLMLGKSANNKPTDAAEGVGKKTILETDYKDASAGFKVSLNGIETVLKEPADTTATANDDKSFTIKIGTVETALSQKELAEAAGLDPDDAASVGAKIDAKTIAQALADKLGGEWADAASSGKAYTVKADGENLVFTAKDSLDTDPIRKYAVSIKGVKEEKVDATGNKYASSVTYTAGTASTTTVSATIKAKINGTEQTFSLTGQSSNATVASLATAMGGATATIDGKTVTLGQYFKITANAGGNGFDFESKDTSADAPAVTSFTIADTTTTNGATIAGTGGESTDAKAAYTVGTTGYSNAATQVIVTADAMSPDQLASTTLDLTGKLVDGAKLTLGGQSVVLAIGDNSKYKDMDGAIAIDDAHKDNADYICSKITEAFKDNETFTVGHDTTDAKITLKQKAEVKGSTDMSSMEKFASYIGYGTVDEEATKKAQGEAQAKVEEAEAKQGKALSLQIGDTAESFNKMDVSVKDMHAAAMGIGDIDISTQEGASKAMDAIKNATNYVSDVRGDLGALQNRLDHTINNLSVTQENITDAESTIRDVDIAKEMMAYTKNNILVQSAQAMLAQANQLPQGVLQLLG